MSEPRRDLNEYCITNTLGYLLRRVHRSATQRTEDVFLGEELSFIQWVVLVHLRDRLVDTSSGLARALGHDSGATTRMLDQLEDRGLVARERSSVDRRVIRLALTVAGHAAADRMIPRITERWKWVMEPFSDPEVEQLKALLARLLARLDAAAAGDRDA